MASKSKIENEIKGHQPQRHIYTPLGMCVCNMKTMQQMLSEISQKADLHPLGDVFMQDESKPVCVLKTNKSTLDNSPPPNYDRESKDECHHVNNNPRYKWYVKTAAFQVIAPTGSNYGRKINVKNRNKSTILIFLPAIIELVQELLISNMHNKLEEDTCENVEVIVPTRSNYWRKMRKIAINRPFWIFFQPLLNLSKNYLLVTCITNLKRICEKLFKLSRPQGQIIDVKWEKSQ